MLALLACAALQDIRFPDLVAEMSDLDRLARLPSPSYRTVQYSSYDRRSQAPGRPDWFSNADGFGGEPIPGFAAVLRAPEDGKPGLYLVCDEDGPGAIVRGWSAGMQGVLRVYLDGAQQPLFEGEGARFLARRSEHWRLDPGDALRQEDADYMPIPYAKHLRVTWEGSLDDLHFYHLDVRRYQQAAQVKSFDPAADLAAERMPELEAALARLHAPAAPPADYEHNWDLRLKPRETVTVTLPDAAPAAVRLLELQLDAADPARALRGVVLRMSFDGAAAPQVEAPVGDFFGAGPGLQPFDSLPLRAGADGLLQCRWVMPYEKSLRLEFENTTGQEVSVRGRARLSPWDWDERSLHFHAGWRVDHGIVLPEGGRLDLPFLQADGPGRLCGVAVQIVNPAPCPHPAGSWWGEGDEKVFVDGESFPSWFGTGSEDYFNYSWSRPDLFAHPYCGQPLDSGPANAGYVSNYRFQVLDDVPFAFSLSFAMELWPHTSRYPISYGRTLWWYARPGAGDELPRLAAKDCVVPALQHWEPRAIGGASDSVFYLLRDPSALSAQGSLEMVEQPLAASGRLLRWDAQPGQKLRLPVKVDADGKYAVNLVALHAPEAGAVALSLDGAPLAAADAGGGLALPAGGNGVPLRIPWGTRILSTGFQPVDLTAGAHELAIECTGAGTLAFDYVWIQARH